MGEFVGRDTELAQVRELLADARRGRGRGMLVLGAPGVGKTRLLAEGALAAADEGVRVARAACLSLTTPLPFDPAVELLRSIGVRVRGAAAGSPRDLFGTFVDRFEQLSLDGPVLLCLDDLQWCDVATLDLVQYCLARLGDLPLVWLLAARSGQAQANVSYRFEHDGTVDRVELEPLSLAEVRLLAEATLPDAEVSDEVVKAVYHRAGGNPFLCGELLRALPRSGTAGVAPVENLVPTAVSEAIGARASGLPAVARAALEWAAVLPEPFAFEELEAVAGADAASTPEDLAEAGFLAGDDDGRWRFVHSIVRDAIYRRLGQRERVRRHGLVADSLAGAPLARLAPQLEHARRWTEAAEAYVRLADEALNRGRGEDAKGLYERAFGLAAGDDQLRRRAQAGRVHALLRSGDADAARREAGVLRAELRAAGDPVERLGFLSRYARALMVIDVADVEGAQDAMDEARPLIERGSGALVAEALATRAFVEVERGDQGDALADAERAANVAKATDDPALRARVLHSLGHVSGRVHGPARGIPILERAVEEAMIAGLPVEASVMHMQLAFLFERAADLSAIEAHTRLALELEHLPPSHIARHQSNLGGVLAMRGDLNQGLAYQLAAQRQAERVGPRLRARIVLTHIYLHIWRGELAAARRLLEAREAPGSTVDEARVAEAWGLLLEAEGAPAEALAWFRRGATGSDVATALYSVVGAARTAAALGDLPSVRAAVASLDDRAGDFPVGEWMRQEAHGWLATSEGRVDDAVACFRAAAQASGVMYTATRLRLEAARLAGDRAEILAAIDAFDRMGAARAADRARAVARGLGMRPGRRRARAGALSAREQEVAQLIAAGQTNAEIAAALYLSPRTVERHVSNILTKLNLNTRVQVAAEAAAGRLPGSEPVPVG